MKRILSIIILSVAAMFLATGCSVKLGGSKNTAQQANPTPGGIFKSLDKGDTWARKTAIPTASGKPDSIGEFSAEALVMDPGDKNALYLGTPQKGLYFSYDGGETWQYSKKLGEARVPAVAVHPQFKCTIYAAAGNKLMKSVDCSRNWEQAYVDTSPKVTIESVMIDQNAPSTVYAGTSRGEILKSMDGGESWRTAGRLESLVKKILANPKNGNIIFAITDRKGVFRSNDSGETWVSIVKEKLKGVKGANNPKDLIMPGSADGLVLLATDSGIARSNDNGETWEELTLITPEKKTPINALAGSPKDPNEIYYVTDTTFYRSTDGGTAWATIKLPTGRSGWKLLIDPENPSVIYLGVRMVEKK